LGSALAAFRVFPDYDLDIMSGAQTVAEASLRRVR
jgi:hypothetical protein